MDIRKISASLLLLGLFVVGGCTLNRSAELRQNGDGLLAKLGAGGQVIEPKRSLLTVIHLSRPLGEPAVNEILWRSADEQAVPHDIRRAWQANGLRIGLLTGELPIEVDTLIKAPPPNKVDPAQIFLADGDFSILNLCPQLPEANILLNLQGRPHAKDFQLAQGFLRVTSKQEAEGTVALRFVPQIHHGPVQTTYGTTPSGGNLAPKDLMIRNGQKEEMLRDLAASLSLKPNQIAVIGGYANRPRSLGSFLFTQLEPNSDRVLQTVLLIWAKPSQPAKPAAASRPPLIPVEGPPTI